MTTRGPTASSPTSASQARAATSPGVSSAVSAKPRRA